jgi:hypothetical protein
MISSLSLGNALRISVKSTSVKMTARQTQYWSSRNTANTNPAVDKRIKNGRRKVVLYGMTISTVLLTNRLQVESYLILEGEEGGALTKVAALVVVP